jgi:hypothetical protein
MNFWTVAELASAWGVTLQRIRFLIKKKKLLGVKRGGVWHLTDDSVQEEARMRELRKEPKPQ